MVKFVFVVKCMAKLKHCWIGTKIGVAVDIDSLIMVVVYGKICGNMCGKTNLGGGEKR